MISISKIMLPLKISGFLLYVVKFARVLVTYSKHLLLHVPRLPSQPASNVRGLLICWIGLNWPELAWQYTAIGIIWQRGTKNLLSRFENTAYRLSNVKLKRICDHYIFLFLVMNIQSSIYFMKPWGIFSKWVSYSLINFNFLHFFQAYPEYLICYQIVKPEASTVEAVEMSP